MKKNHPYFDRFRAFLDGKDKHFLHPVSPPRVTPSGGRTSPFAPVCTRAHGDSELSSKPRHLWNRHHLQLENDCEDPMVNDGDAKGGKILTP